MSIFLFVTEGHTFKAETMPETPFATWDLESGKIGAVIGELWHEIFEKSLNFTTDISQPLDMKWGSSNDDGTWNGMAGGLLENRSKKYWHHCTRILKGLMLSTFQQLLVKQEQECSSRILEEKPFGHLLLILFIPLSG